MKELTRGWILGRVLANLEFVTAVCLLCLLMIMGYSLSNASSCGPLGEREQKAVQRRPLILSVILSVYWERFIFCRFCSLSYCVLEN